ncbi:MAG: ATP-dependent protease ATPase subunit HslU [Acidobacteria bacterium]|nr:ATP-dependent protease ATPase subunit HslU [Acidobacteriota bacterium]
MPVFLMPSGDLEPRTPHDALTPRMIVEQLDRYIVGQAKAKRAVAIALRNRIRRQRLPAHVAEEISPKNILMIGPTGVGKTEIARRLARLAGSPFLKVEASKFTEVGYVGRDVDSMVRDLTEIAVEMVRSEKLDEVRSRGASNAEERLLDLLLPPLKAGPSGVHGDAAAHAGTIDEHARFRETRERIRIQLREGKLDERAVEVEAHEKASPFHFEVYTGSGVEEMVSNLQDMLPNMFSGKPKRRRMKVSEALSYLTYEEQQKLIDPEQTARTAIERVEQSGIVFLDEIDKVAGRESGRGPDVSREGVQRDLLPIIEGTSVNTKYGMVRTDHVLFIAAGAFHVSKPSDLIPELQGRFPIRVELDSLSKADFVRILREPQNALVKQYQALMSTEGMTIEFTDDALEVVAEFAFRVNESTENIGARRLHTVMERLLDEVSFEGSEMPEKRLVIDAAYVHRMLDGIVQDQDLSRFIL